MQGPDIEAAAHVIADNAVSAFIHERDDLRQISEVARMAAISAVMRELLRVMPTDSGDLIAEACNRGLEALSMMGVSGPHVAAVDLDDGSVTMR